MKLGLMIEVQEGLSWDRWFQIVAWAEELGYESLWLSDHLMPLSGGPAAEPIDPFLALGYAATRTSRIRLGTLVCPVTFRNPAIVARLAAGVAHLSDGRFILGLGAGWHEPEHRAFHIDLPPVRERMAQLDHAAGTIRALLGHRPTPPGEPRLSAAYPVPVLIGGAGEQYTLKVVATHADEWNAPGFSVGFYRRKVAALARHCASVGRDPAQILRSVVFTHAIAPSARQVRRLEATMTASTPRQYWPGRHDRSPAWLIGTPPEVVRQILAYAEEGVDRIMMQWRTPPSRAEVELVAREVLPHVQPARRQSDDDREER